MRRALGALALVAIVAGAWGWWHLRHWTPERAVYPLQGVEIGVDDGEVSWKSLKAIGADFAYIDASASAFARDPAFVDNFEAAKAAGMQVGALHRYDPCQPARRRPTSSPPCRATPSCCRPRSNSTCWPTTAR
ncbi:GH25 family lysozyme [Novosphingobium resinovorum]